MGCQMEPQPVLLKGGGISGCSLHASGSAQGSLQSMLISLSNVHPDLAKKANSFHDFLKQTYKINPELGFINDAKSPNAFATPERVIHPSSDGTILLGVNLLTKEFKKNPVNWEGAAAMVHAHEFGHIAQFVSGISGPTPLMELQADALAGATLAHYIIVERVLMNAAYAAALAVANHRQGELTQASKSLFSIGDYAFNSPDYHGTPSQRVYAFQNGFTLIATAPIALPIKKVLVDTQKIALEAFKLGA